MRHFPSFLNLYARHCQELPNYIHYEILDMSIAVLAAVTIFPPSPRWTYWVINMRSTSTDDVIRLASLRHQLCVLDVCQNRVLPSPYSRLPSVLKPTGPGIACQTCGESQRPVFGPCPSQKKEYGIEMDSTAHMI